MVVRVIENPNFLGELFILAKNTNPYLELVGGLTGQKLMLVSALEYNEGVYASQNAASQPALTEDQTIAGVSETDFTRSASSNTVQFYQRAVNVSYAKMSVPGFVTADAVTGLLNVGQPRNVEDEMAFQIQMNLTDIMNMYEFVGLRGVYAQQTAHNVAPKTRGLLPHTTTNVVASTGDLKEDVNTLVRTMVLNKAPLRQAVILVHAFQKQQISKVWGYAPADRHIGGLNLKQIETDFGIFPVMYVPNTDPTVLEIAEMSVIKPVACPVPGKGILFYDAKEAPGASVKGQIYGQLGWDNGPEVWHGKLTGLATA